jgi:hypothetical protein
MMTRKLILAAAALVMMFTGACASGPHALIRPSSEVAQLFESHQVLPDHQYHFSGSVSLPTAIVGIRDDHRLQSTGWKPVELDAAQLKRWISVMTQDWGVAPVTAGAAILDPTGERVGIWYSLLQRPAVSVGDDRVVQVTAPSPHGPRNQELFRGWSRSR